MPGVASGGERSAGQDVSSGAGKALAAYPGAKLKMQTRTLRKGLLLVPPAGQVWRFYYYAGTTRIAMRTGSGTGTSGLNWLLGDHLGSTAITADSSGNKVAELRYKAWGETRYTYGTTPTKRQYTSQLNETTIGLYFFNARWYDSALGRWAQPDSIVPVGSQGVQAWDRYAFVNNNPLRYTDPTGHMQACPDGDICEHDYVKHPLNPWRQPANQSAIGRDKAAYNNEDYLQLFINHVNSPLHGRYQYGNFLGPCTTAVCVGLHPGMDSQNMWTSVPPIVVNFEGRPIYAISFGVVARVGLSDWGKYVMVEHNVYGSIFYSVYAHLDTQDVFAGDIVDKNTMVGTMGNTVNPPCPNCDIHLHFEIRNAGNVDLSQKDPFRGMLWWPKSLYEFYENWVDLSNLFY